MPHGVLYIKVGNTHKWVDAYDTYGLSLSEAGLSQLMTPAPNKDAVTNKNIITHGVSIMQGSFYKEVRQVSLDCHITAPNKATFLQRYAKFCSEVLDVGYFKLQTTYQPGVAYWFVFVSCNQYSEFSREMAKFTLSLEEPHPEQRTDSDEIVYDADMEPVVDANDDIVTVNRLALTIAQMNTLLTETTDNSKVDTVPELVNFANAFLATVSTLNEFQAEAIFNTTIE